MQPINPKHLKTVNRCLRALDRYNELNDMRNDAENNGDERTVRKLERKCEEVFDRYLNYLHELPKNQQKQIEKIL